MSKQKVAVAMSGGVDSSMAAALLKEAGYEVSGVHMLSRTEVNSVPLDLEQTCHLLGIPLYKLNLQKEFQNLVIDYVCQEYNLGRTPNPCIVCNRNIKFGLLLEKVRQMGADCLATGHYARIVHTESGYGLLKGVDPSRDQSYFLYTLGQRQLQHLLFPIGDFYKTEVRRLAAKLGLPVANKPASRDMCFIPDSDYRAFIAQRIPPKSGDIVNTEGKIIGRHGGLARYTIGQRHGLGLASDKPRYVLKLDAADNRVVVGTRDQLLGSGLSAGKLSWVSGEAPQELGNITAKIRYKSPEVAVKLQLNNGGCEVQFKESQRAIAPGQSIVFYQGDVLLGGGIIEGANTVFC